MRILFRDYDLVPLQRGVPLAGYPKLLKVKTVPSVWKTKGLSDQDWRDFLKIALDFVVRNGGSLEIRDEIWPWLGLPQRRTAIVASSTEDLGRWQRRWPSVRRSGTNSLLVRLLAKVLNTDLQTADGQDIVDSLLDAAWMEEKTLLKQTANGYVLPLEELAFRPMQEAWVCPFTRRLLDTTLNGVSPYIPRRVSVGLSPCERVDIPIYDAPFGGSADGDLPVRRGRGWLDEQPAIRRLREEGVWSTFNDRVVEFAMYFTAAEHSAQQSSSKLQEYERRFKEGRINILSCSTTMEMGIDIGGVQQVAMNNVPPHPANYLQRAGRAGRRQETRSTALTLCKANPHDQNVFLNTRWPFDTVLAAPVVSLNSAVIVQRHVNAVVLARFLRNLLVEERRDLHKLTCGWFFVGSQSDAPAAKLLTWCQAYIEGSDTDFDQGLRRLIRHTVFEGQPLARLLIRCGSEIERVAETWLKEWNALLEEETAIERETSDPASKAIAFQKHRLAEEYLLRELATGGFLPAYGFPSNVVSFDNLTISGLRNLPILELNGTGENNRYFRRELASRDVVTALREYSPGADIVLDGLVYRSAGITLNWHIPATESDARETQAIKFAWKCNRCGSSGTSVVLPRNCDACGFELSDCEKFLEPAGFSVDFYVDPHNNISRPTYLPVERPWVSARGEWSPLANPSFGRFRTTSEGRVYHHSRGANGTNYAICLACGRAEPQTPDGELPEIFTRAQGHYKLRAKKADRLCPGSSNRWAITRVALGHESRTDMLELQLRNVNEQLINEHPTALTLAVALRDALAELLGVQAAELGCDAREVRSSEGERCQSIFIFDRYAAGYSSGAENLVNQLFQRAAKILDCPKHCDSSCPNCILDFDQRFEASKLDRHAALRFLNPTWLNALKLPVELCHFGASSRAETSTIVDAVLRESRGADSSTTQLFVDGIGGDFATSAARTLAYKLLSLSRPVAVVINVGSLSKLSECDRHSLAAIAEHPGASVHVIDTLPIRNGATTIAEVVRANGSVAWACSDWAITKATDAWGNSCAPLVIGTSTPMNIGEARTPSSLRPAIVVSGDAELSIQHQLDGVAKSFGLRFWKLVTQLHPASKDLLTNAEASVISLAYNDRYLFTPVSVALLQSIAAGLKHFVGAERFGMPELSINTSAVRQDGQKWLGGKVFADWPTSQMRDAVAELVFRPLGKVKINSSQKLQHSRVLEIRFSIGLALGLRLDQGVSYWRVSSWKKSGANGIWFDFANLDAVAQAKAVVEMDVWVEGQTAPTQVFAKVRKTEA
jgi:hypothetical protein